MTADPLAGDPASVKSLASKLAARSTSIAAGATVVKLATTRAQNGWSGSSKDRFMGTAATLPTAADRIRGHLDAAVSVLNSYAEHVRQIQDEAQRILTAQRNNAEDIATNAHSVAKGSKAASGDDASDSERSRVRSLQSHGDDLSSTKLRLEAQWQDLVNRRAAADRAAASGLSSVEAVGKALAYQSSLPGMSDKEFLAALATMAPEQLAVLRGTIASRLGAMSPEVVQAWWNSMGGRGSAGEHSAAQDALITALPATIGNLDGVAYWARDQANRISAQRAFTQAQQATRAAKKALEDAIGRTAQLSAQRTLDAAVEREAALKNFLAGVRTPLNGVGDMDRQIVSFRDGRPPLGAVAVGRLDTADNVSYLVPGMGTTLKDTTILMRASANVIATQRLSANGGNTAMVSWIGYEAPGNVLTTGDPGVFGQAHAKAGAERLADDLGGFHATRPDATLNVVAHSYGSTTAAITLHDHARLGVHSFVTLGSAGIPRDIPDAGAINADHMYSAQADEQWNVAQIGRQLSFPERLDPTQKNFGSTVIDASDVNGTTGVNVHDLLVNPDGDLDADHGYLDLDTNTLLETAKATLR